MTSARLTQRSGTGTDTGTDTGTPSTVTQTCRVSWLVVLILKRCGACLSTFRHQSAFNPQENVNTRASKQPSPSICSKHMPIMSHPLRCAEILKNADGAAVPGRQDHLQHRAKRHAHSCSVCSAYIFICTSVCLPSPDVATRIAYT